MGCSAYLRSVFDLMATVLSDCTEVKHILASCSVLILATTGMAGVVAGCLS
jgi:hypothetical protein